MGVYFDRCVIVISDMKIINNVGYKIKDIMNRFKVFIFNLRPEKLFLFTAILFGIGFSIINPLFQAPDEHSHYYRAAGMANGSLLPIIENDRPGTKIQSGSIELFKYYDLNNQISKGAYRYQIKKMLALPLGSFREKFFLVSTTLYTPVSYLPQVITYFIASLVKANPLIIFILVRLSGLLVWVALVYYSIKIIPRGKWLLATLALLPISLFISSVVSADTVTNGLTFLTVAMVYAALARPKALTKKYLIVLILLFVLLALAKQGMALVSFLILLLPTPSYLNKNKFRIIKGLTVIAAIGLSLAWQLYIAPIASILTLEGTNSSQQLAFILASPLRILKIFWNTYLNFGTDGIYTTFFVALGMLNVVLPIWLGFAWVIALVVSAGSTDNTKKDSLNLYQKIYFSLVALGLFGAITAALYLTWTRPGSDQVAGLQGRYFVPVLAILIPVITSNKLEPKNKTKYYLIVLILLLQFFALWLFLSYYRYHLVY